MDIRTKRPHAYEVRPGVTRTLPAGWAGNVNDEVGQAAVDLGNAVRTDGGSAPASVTSDFVPPVGPFEAREKAPGWWAIFDGAGQPVGRAVRKADLDGFNGFTEDKKLAFAVDHAKAALDKG